MSGAHLKETFLQNLGKTKATSMTGCFVKHSGNIVHIRQTYILTSYYGGMQYLAVRECISI